MCLAHLLMYLIKSCWSLKVSLSFLSELKRACNRDVLPLLCKVNGDCSFFDIYQLKFFAAKRAV